MALTLNDAEIRRRIEEVYLEQSRQAENNRQRQQQQYIDWSNLRTPNDFSPTPINPNSWWTRISEWANIFVDHPSLVNESDYIFRANSQLSDESRETARNNFAQLYLNNENEPDITIVINNIRNKNTLTPKQRKTIIK